MHLIFGAARCWDLTTIALVMLWSIWRPVIRERLLPTSRTWLWLTYYTDSGADSTGLWWLAYPMHICPRINRPTLGSSDHCMISLKSSTSTSVLTLSMLKPVHCPRNYVIARAYLMPSQNFFPSTPSRLPHTYRILPLRPIPATTS